MSGESQNTLRDALEQSFDHHSDDFNRDEIGRFAAQPEPEEQTQPIAEESNQIVSEVQVESAPVKIPRPSSWKKDFDTHWETLDPSLQDYINKREQDYAKGVSTYKSQWDSAAPVYNAIQQFMPELQQHNIDPSQWISNLGNAHRTLALGSPEQKLQMFAKLATDYGVPLESLFNGQQQANPQFSMLAQELSQIKNDWNSFKSAQERQEQASILSEIEQFKQNSPHFDDVRETMAQLLDSGVANDLKSAYDKAVRLNDDVWGKLQAEQAQNSVQEQVEKAAKAKAKTVSPKSASPTGTVNNGSGKKSGSIRDILAEQVESAFGAGRL